VLWVTPDLAGLAQIGLGSIAGACTAVFILRRFSTGSALVVVNVIVGFAVGALTMAGLRWPDFAIWAAVGFVSAAAPMTLAVSPPEAFNSRAAAVRYVRRAGRRLLIFVICGIAFGGVGFVCALATVRIVTGST
jgi:hypothetical protein